MDASRERIARLYEQLASSIDEALAGLKLEDWTLPTDCPEWTVHDIVAHLSSFEAISVGMATHAADADVSGYPYASGFNEPIERDIEVRRSWPHEQVADEFRDATLKRAEALRGMSDEEFATGTVPLPFGDAPNQDIMPIRIIDLYFHEQDVRRATGNPGHLDGEVAQFCFERMRQALPVVLGKKVGLAAGQTVVFNLTSHAGTTIGFGVGDDGRVAQLATVPADPTVRIATDLEHFLMLTGGRRAPAEHLAKGAVSVEGDTDLAGRILESLAVTP